MVGSRENILKITNAIRKSSDNKYYQSTGYPIQYIVQRGSFFNKSYYHLSPSLGGTQLVMTKIEKPSLADLKDNAYVNEVKEPVKVERDIPPVRQGRVSIYRGVKSGHLEEVLIEGNKVKFTFLGTQHEILLPEGTSLDLKDIENIVLEPTDSLDRQVRIMGQQQLKKGEFAKTFMIDIANIFPTKVGKNTIIIPGFGHDRPGEKIVLFESLQSGGKPMKFRQNTIYGTDSGNLYEATKNPDGSVTIKLLEIIPN